MHELVNIKQFLTLTQEQITSHAAYTRLFVCVYFLISRKRIVYVGASFRGKSREFDHHKDKNFRGIFYLKIDDLPKDKKLAEIVLRDIENFYIKKFKPKYNKSKKGDI